MTTYELNFEDLRSKYTKIMYEYQNAKEKTNELQVLLHEKQNRYIERESEYKDVIKQMDQAIEDNSSMPLKIIEEKTEDDYLLDGIDIHDKVQAKKIQRLKEINAKNTQLIGGCSKNIKDIHEHHTKINKEIDKT